MSDSVSDLAPSAPPSESLSEGSSFCVVDTPAATLGTQHVRALMEAIKQIQLTKKYLQLSAVEVGHQETFAFSLAQKFLGDLLRR